MNSTKSTKKPNRDTLNYRYGHETVHRRKILYKLRMSSWNTLEAKIFQDSNTRTSNHIHSHLHTIYNK